MLVGHLQRKRRWRPSPLPGACWLALLLACNTDPPEPPETTDAAMLHGRENREAGQVGENCSLALCAPYACDSQWDVCRMTCESSEHCSAGFVCDAGFCIGTECTEENARVTCGPYACVLGRCAASCSSSGCSDGYYCRADTLRCVERCTSREDPRCEGYVCDVSVGECEPYCRDGQLECANGFVCNSEGECAQGP